MTILTITSSTRGPDTADHPPLTHTPPASYAPLDQSPRQHTRSTVFYLFLALVLSIVDAILIKTTYNAVLLEGEWVSWLMATLTALGATALAWFAGHSAVIAHVNRDRAAAIRTGLAAATWAIVGAGLFYLRYTAASLGNTAIAAEGTTTAAETAAADTATHQLLAWVFITLYLLPGTLAALHAYELSNPIAENQRASHARVTALRNQLPHDEAKAAEIALILGRHHAERARIPQAAQNARDAAADLAAELKAFAATEVARHIGTPWAIQDNPTAQAAADSGTPQADAA